MSLFYGIVASSSVVNITAEQVLWLEADYYNNDLGDDESVTTTWVDQSGQNNNAEPTGDPIFWENQINGHSIIRFNGTSSLFEIADSVSLSSPEITIFAVGKFIAQGVQQGWICFKNGDISSDPAAYGLGRLFFGGDPVTFSFNNGGGWSDHTGTTVSLDTYYLITAIYDGSNWYIRVNGSQTGSGSASGSLIDTTGSLQLGGYNQSFSNAEYLNGDIAEIMIYNGAITGTPLSVIESNLMTKYGL